MSRTEDKHQKMDMIVIDRMIIGEALYRHKRTKTNYMKKFSVGRRINLGLTLFVVFVFLPSPYFLIPGTKAAADGETENDG